MQTLSLRTFLASYSFTSSFPLSYLVPSQSARFFFFTTKLPPGLFGLNGYLPSCKLILYPLFTSLFSFPSFPCPYQPHNMIFTGLFGLIGYLPSCKLILFPLLHFFPFFSFLPSWLLLTDSLDGGLKSWNLQLHRLSSPVRIHYAPFKLYWNPSAALSLCTMSPKDVSASIFTIRILCLSLTPPPDLSYQDRTLRQITFRHNLYGCSFQ